MIRKRFVEVEGRAIHYLRAGSGPAVVLLHSAVSNGESLMGLIAHLSGRFTCFAFDIPGFGRSDGLRKDSIEAADLADDLARTVAAVGLPPCPLFGTHTGAAIALEFGVRHPERVTGLVLDGVPIFQAEELARFGEDYFAPVKLDDSGGVYARTWTRSRDSAIWFPWTVRRPGNLNPMSPDGPESPELIHLSTMNLFRCATSYAAPYRAGVWYGARAQKAAAALDRPAVFVARSIDVLFPHLDYLPPLKPGQTVRRLGPRMAELDALVAESFAAWPAAGAPGDANPFVPCAAITKGYVDLPDKQVFIRVAGDASKPALLVLHDAPGSGLALEPLLAALGKSFHVCAPDLPGCGETPPLTVGATVGEIAETLTVVMRALGFGAAAIYGVGFGASAAVELAARRPELVNALLLCGLALPHTEERAEMRARYAPPIEIKTNGSHWYDTWLMLRDSLIWFPWYARNHSNQRRFAGDFSAERLHAWTLEVMKQAISYSQLIDAALALDAGARLADVRAPIVICADPATPLSAHTGRLTALLPNAPAIDVDRDPAAHTSQLVRALRAAKGAAGERTWVPKTND